MIEIHQASFPSTVAPRLPLSKSEGLRQLILAYLLAKRRVGTVLPPLWDERTSLVPEDLQVMHEALEALLRGDEEIRLSASASVARFLFALSAASGRSHRLLLTDPQLARRPMAPLLDFLCSIGVSIDISDRCWQIDPKGLEVPRGAIIDARGWESSQFVSSIIYLSVSLGHPLAILRSASEGSAKYIQLTIDSLRSIGHNIRWDQEKIEVLPQEKLIPEQSDIVSRPIPADWTAVSYWIELFLLHPEVEKLILTPVDPDSAHPDSAILTFLDSFIHVDRVGNRVEIGRRESSPEELSLDLSQNPDLFPTLFVTALGLGLRARFTGLSSLQHKESDRLRASLSIAEDLGWSADAFETDGTDFVVYSGVPRETHPRHIRLDHRDDHRLAIAFGVLATDLEGLELEIDDERVTERSYPRFFSELCGLMSDDRDEEEK